MSRRLSQLGAKRQRRSRGGQDIIPAGSDRVLVHLKVLSSPRLLSACPPLGAGEERRRRRRGGGDSRAARLPLSHPDVGGSVGNRSAGQLAGPRGSCRLSTSRSSSCCSGSLFFLPLGSAAAAVTPIIRLPIPALAAWSLHLLSRHRRGCVCVPMMMVRGSSLPLLPLARFSAAPPPSSHSPLSLPFSSSTFAPPPPRSLFRPFNTFSPVMRR